MSDEQERAIRGGDGARDPTQDTSSISAEEKIRIVLEGLRGEQSVKELCRREGIGSNLYYRWSKDFLEEIAAGQYAISYRAFVNGLN